MKHLLFALFAALALAGCGNPPVKVKGPTAVAVKSGIAKVETRIKTAQKIVSTLEIPQAQPLAVELTAAAQELEAAQTAVDELQGKIDQQTEQFAATTDRMIQAETKLSDTRFSLWRWRIIAALEIVIFAGYFAARGWLKVQFPFLANIL